MSKNVLFIVNILFNILRVNTALYNKDDTVALLFYNLFIEKIN